MKRLGSRCSLGAAAALTVVLLAACSSEPALPPVPPLLVWHAPAPVRNYVPAPDVPPSYMVLLPNDDGTTGQVFLQNGPVRQTLSRPRQAADLQGGAPAFSVTDAQLRRDFGAVMAARPAMPEHYRIFYPTGSSSLTPQGRQQLQTIVDRSQRFGALEVSVIGHTDTVGDDEANFELGLRRARDFAETLVAMGIRAAHIEIGSDGAHQPLVPTPPRTSEARNRRIEITLR